MDRVKQNEQQRRRQRAHERLDHFLDLASRERLWGEVLIRVKIEDGDIQRVGFNPDLGEKF